MAAQARQSKREAKVLRIGIVQDGRIVQERLIRQGEPVTAGESAKNTFVFPRTHLPNAQFTVFRPEGEGYVLQCTDKMEGKISSDGEVVALNKLAGDRSIPRKNGLAQLPLTEQDRGKITIDSVTVLFQFVPQPPPRPARSIQQMDFSPRLIDEDDPIFLGFVAIWAALAAMFVVWVWNTEPREVTLEEIPDRFVEIVMQPKETIETPPPEIEKTETTDTIARGEVQPRPAAKPKAAPKTEVEEVKAEAQRKDELVEQSKLLLKIIGTRGESQGGVVDNLWSDEEQGLGDIDKALAQTSGVTTKVDESGTRTGNAGGTEAVDIGDLAGVGGGSAGDVSGPVATVKPVVSTGSGSIDTISGEDGSIRSTVEKYGRQLNYCYENRLKAVPTLQGRVQVAWEVGAGKVIGSPLIEVNTTGDAALADCVVKKIRRWQFAADVEGDLSWPFVFQQKN